MRHYYHFSILKEKYLVILLALILFLGLGLKANGQSKSMLVGNNFDAIQTSIKLQLQNNVQLLIPKMTEEQMLMAQNVEQFMMVFKTNADQGFYAFQNQNWKKLNVREAIVEAHNNMQLALTDLSALILVAEDEETVELVDYNKHISNINAILHQKAQTYAVNDEE